jgi:hypothetical protein
MRLLVLDRLMTETANIMDRAECSSFESLARAGFAYSKLQQVFLKLAPKLGDKGVSTVKMSQEVELYPLLLHWAVQTWLKLEGSLRSFSDIQSVDAAVKQISLVWLDRLSGSESVQSCTLRVRIMMETPLAV